MIPTTMFRSVVILSALVIVNSGHETPIIGILSQETYIVSHLFPGEQHDSFIAASYVKYIESAGGRVIPIWIGQSQEYYNRVVNYTNGIVFPGGGTYFNTTGGYGEAANIIYQLALKANKNGIYYPIWGLCLGMEVLTFAALNGKDIRVECMLKNTALPLHFTIYGELFSRQFSNTPKKILNSLRHLNLTYNFHRYCLTKKVLEENGLLSEWMISSTNKDINQLEFISSMESKDFPIYGMQFHPEKNAFEFERSGIPHSRKAVEVSQYFANFFIDEARKNNNTFPSNTLTKKSLIYNYSPRYTGMISKSSYEQIYVFNQSDFKAAQLL